MAVSNCRRTTREGQRLADQRRRCGDAKGLRPERGDEGRDLGAASGGAERSRDRAEARPCPRDREQPPGENGRHPAQASPAPERCLSLEEREASRRARRPRPTKLELCRSCGASSQSICERTTPPSRSRTGSRSDTPTMRRCGSPTRRSTAPSTSRRGGRSGASSPGT